ncbi:MAG TPA: hypothetical protein VE979_16675 [Streptosporangiaceae bacterium]|nr:hypothetical protein [Streptosporangiaceae bacterium]
MTVPDANAGRGRGAAPGAGKPAEGDSASPGAAEAKPGAETDPGAGEAKPGAQTQPGAADAPAAAGQAKTAAGGAKADAAQAKTAAGETKLAAAETKLAAAETKGAGGSELTDDEHAELQRLREEVAQLRSQPGGPAGPAAPGRRRHLGWRGPVATVLIVVGCLLAPLSVFAVWTANQVSNTDRYVANVEPLIHDPSVQRAITDDITRQITTRLNVKGLAEQAAGALTQRGLTRVGALLNNFSSQLASATYGFIHTQVAKIVASPQVARLWVQVNRQVHAQLVKALSGQSNGAVTISNNQVVLNLGPFINVVKRDLANRGLTIVTRLPNINPTLALFSAKYLVKAQAGYRLLNTLKWALPFISLALLGLGVYVARSHRRALIGAGLGLAASMVVLGLGLTIFRGVYLNSVPPRVLPADAAAVLYDTLIRFIRDGLRIILVVGLIIAIAAFFSGPSVTAVRTRGAFKSGFDWLRRSGEHAGVSTGPAGRWTYTHRRALRITAVIIASLVFVFWGLSSWVTAVVIAVVLLIVLGLIELIGRPPAQPQVAAQPSG